MFANRLRICIIIAKKFNKKIKEKSNWFLQNTIFSSISNTENIVWFHGIYNAMPYYFAVGWNAQTSRYLVKFSQFISCLVHSACSNP